MRVGAFKTRSEKRVKNVPALEKRPSSCFAYIVVSASNVANDTSFGAIRTTGPVCYQQNCFYNTSLGGSYHIFDEELEDLN